jgi:hypothetical protein
MTSSSVMHQRHGLGVSGSSTVVTAVGQASPSHGRATVAVSGCGGVRRTIRCPRRHLRMACIVKLVELLSRTTPETSDWRCRVHPPSSNKGAHSSSSRTSEPLAKADEEYNCLSGVAPAESPCRDLPMASGASISPRPFGRLAGLLVGDDSSKRCRPATSPG